MSSPKAAVAEAANTHPSRFSLQASAEPGVMPRVLELFAKRGLVPDCWHSVVAQPGKTLSIDIEIEGLEGELPTVRVSYQPCDEARCLPTETLEVVFS